MEETKDQDWWGPGRYCPCGLRWVSRGQEDNPRCHRCDLTWDDSVWREAE